MKSVQRRNLILIGIVFLALILISGCVKKAEKEEGPTIKDTNGVEISFVPGAPPSQVVSGDSFDVGVKVENKGESEILPNDLIVYLLGVNPNTIEGLGDGEGETPIYQYVEEELAPVRKHGESIYPGGLTYLNWDDLVYGVSVEADQKLTFVAQTCYYYRTRAEATVCFNTNPFAQTLGSETCKVEGAKDVSNTIAPVKVTEIREAPAGKDKYSFTFTIKNVGSGKVYDKTKELTKCTELKTGDLDQVYVTKVLIGGTEVCTDKTGRSPNGYKVRLIGGEGQFTCTVDLSDAGLSTGHYSELLRIIVDYGYYEQTTTSMTVKTQFERCTGIPDSCDSFTTENDCNSQEGCVWDSTSATCTGTPTRCSSFLSQTTCEQQQGCSWEV